MIEKTFTNNELKIELILYIDTKQNIWFKGKDIAKSSDTFIPREDKGDREGVPHTHPIP